MFNLLSQVKLHSLFLRNAITAHALPRIRQLAQHILSRNITDAQNSKPNSDWCSVAPKPTTSCRNHGSRMGAKVCGFLHKQMILDDGSRVKLGGRAYVDELLSECCQLGDRRSLCRSSARPGGTRRLSVPGWMWHYCGRSAVASLDCGW